MKSTLLVALLLAGTLGFSQSPRENRDKAEILKVLLSQQKAWNAYDLEGFMQPYLKSENLTFYGSSGVVKGWKNTLEGYRKSYPTKEHFGQLELRVEDLSKIQRGVYTVMGEFHLARTLGNSQGIFMLVVKKINGKWTIMADTSCAVDPEN